MSSTSNLDKKRRSKADDAAAANNENDNSNNSNSNEKNGPSAAKKAKTMPASPPKQTSLHQFFAKPKSSKVATSKASSSSDSKKESDTKENVKVESKQEKTQTATATSKDDNNKTNQDGDEDAVPGPIIPRQVTPNPLARWKVVNNCMMVRSIGKEAPRTKAAAFDVDGTLLVWRIAGWPSQLEHYELWNSTLIEKLQKLHDEQDMKLVLFSNQGAIRSAFTGKKATHVKTVFEWIVHTIDRPVHIVLSTNKKLGYHKPQPGMWETCERHCNKGEPLDVNKSFFVGDSFGDDDPQGGVDSRFAENVGATKGGTLQFYTPEGYFGPSDRDRRKRQELMTDYEEPPKAAMEARQQLLGGYFVGPIVLLLSGVQGSGKSTFCESMRGTDISNDDNNASSAWVHYSQDSINKGKPGKREAVEESTRCAIRGGRSVIVDRTHLDPTQRKHFVDIAKELKVPVHILFLQPTKDVISQRVRDRTNHAGRVEGDSGVRIAMASLAKAVPPKYEEGFDLISCVKRDNGVQRMSQLYQRVKNKEKSETTVVTTIPVVLERKCVLTCGTAMPTLVLGTMNVGKRIAPEVVRNALNKRWEGVDTAPTYKNEKEVGEGMSSMKNEAFVIVKVPKRVTKAEQVHGELETSLENLKIAKADLLLLHWPCDVIIAGTLKVVWEAMEKCVKDGQVRALGVCNFSVDALRQLLPLCSIPPAVNQVERHPLLPQMELLDFCTNQDIVLQAHTPLGHGKILANETIVKVAEQEKLSPAQAILQWNLMHGVANACKASNEEHQKEAVDVYDKEGPCLSAENMQMLDAITEKQRFISPPFMMAPGSVYSWKK